MIFLIFLKVILSILDFLDLSVHPFVCALMVEPFDLRPPSFAWRSTLTLARLAIKVKVVGQRSGSNVKSLVYLALRSRVAVMVKG